MRDKRRPAIGCPDLDTATAPIVSAPTRAAERTGNACCNRRIRRPRLRFAEMLDTTIVSLMPGPPWGAGVGFGEAEGPAVLVWRGSPRLGEVAPQGVGTAESAVNRHRGDGVVAAFEETCGKQDALPVHPRGGGGAGALPEAAGECARGHRCAGREGIDGQRLVEVPEGPLQHPGRSLRIRQPRRAAALCAFSPMFPVHLG